MNRDFKGIWIPKEIYLADILSWTEKILLIEIDSLDNENGCFASNAYLAEFLKVSEKTVSVSISKLLELGFIYHKSFDGRQRILGSNVKADFTKTSRQTKRKGKGRLHEKVRHNNTVSNTDNNIKNKERVIKLPFSSEIFCKAWEQWKEYKAIEHKFHYKSTQSEQAALMDVNTKSGQNDKVAVEIIMQSIANGWKGFFELKNNTNGQSKKEELAGITERLIFKTLQGQEQ